MDSERWEFLRMKFSVLATLVDGLSRMDRIYRIKEVKGLTRPGNWKGYQHVR